MIRVDRDRVMTPAVLNSPEAREAHEAARSHFAANDARSEQQKFRFPDVFKHEQVRAGLADLFTGKCAFCESMVGASAIAVVHHFRPLQEAMGIEGDVSRPHYWWLAYEWENLYQTCQRCATAAGPRFPVHGERAPVEATGGELTAEKTLLLDPCRDDPEDHLAFSNDGIVAGRTERGTRTIDAFSLNRRSLVEARRSAIADALSTIRGRQGRELMRALEPLLTPSRQYAAAIRQALSRHVEREEPTLRSATSSLRPELTYVSEVETLDAIAGLRRRAVEPVVVERIAIRDFRGIHELDVDLVDRRDSGPAGGDGTDPELLEPPPTQPWTMLIGENGHGKSSVLHALAMALMGANARARLGLNVDGLIRHGAEEALISVWVRDALEPRGIVVRRNTGRMEPFGDDTPAALAAYGAGRLPAARDPGRLPRRYRVRPRIENLFDPHTMLLPSRRWLLSLSDGDFTYAARALREVTLEPESTVLERLDEDVILRRAEGPVSLDQLSDGYRSMIVLATDIMSFFLMRYGSMDAAEGIVLVDEIGTHLHPRWQMRIVEAFRKAFPRLQMIVTTHDPLTLRGMRDQEVVVLRKTQERRVYVLPPEEIPPVQGLRVDELLTSEVFGLSSTIDPKLDALFDRYYGLLAGDAAAADELESVRVQLDRYRQLGATRRERIALEAADEFIAQERNVADASQRRDLSAKTKARLRAIWAGAED